MEKDTREFVYIAHCDQLDRWGNFVDGDAEIFDDLDKANEWAECSTVVNDKGRFECVCYVNIIRREQLLETAFDYYDDDGRIIWFDYDGDLEDVDGGLQGIDAQNLIEVVQRWKRDMEYKVDDAIVEPDYDSLRFVDGVWLLTIKLNGCFCTERGYNRYIDGHLKNGKLILEGFDR